MFDRGRNFAAGILITDPLWRRRADFYAQGTAAGADLSRMATKHGLGFGNGRIVEYEDGTAAYYKPAELTQAFRVPIAEVQGFSVVRSGKMLERSLQVLGSGTVMASVNVPHGVAEKVEAWFRSHPRYRDNAPLTAEQLATVPAAKPADSGSAVPAGGGLLIADELRKLAALRDEGILTDAELAARKALLLARGA